MNPVVTAREKILKKIRNSLVNKNINSIPAVDFSTDVFVRSDESMEIQFAKAFTKVNGIFVFCENESDFLLQLKSHISIKVWTSLHCKEKLLQQMLFHAGIQFSSEEKNFKSLDAGITYCECLVARTGSIIFSSRQLAGRRLSIFPPVHITVAYTNQLMYDISDGLKMLRFKYKNHLPSMISLTTGPSRTADIEKTLVLGAHGPKELYLFLIDKTELNL